MITYSTMDVFTTSGFPSHNLSFDLFCSVHHLRSFPLKKKKKKPNKLKKHRNKLHSHSWLELCTAEWLLNDLCLEPRRLIWALRESGLRSLVGQELSD